MGYSPQELRENAERWRYDDAVRVVGQYEQLAIENEVMKSHDSFIHIISAAYFKAIMTTKEILTLLYNGYPEGAMALSRILYESMIVMRFLYMHKDDDALLQRYIDDYAVKVSRDKVKYFNYLLEYSQSEEEKQEAQRLKVQARKEHNKLKEKYSEFLSYTKRGSYLQDYWWIGNIMQSRNFGAIQNEVTLENLKILYILSCYRAHSGIVGSNMRFGAMFDERDMISSGSLDGFQIPLCFSLVCFGILSETMFSAANIKCDELIAEIEEIIAPFENCLYR